MKRVLSAAAACAVFVWILPLGVFIRPSQEGAACHGKRAFHMCAMARGKADLARSGGVAFTAASGLEKEPRAPAASGDPSFTTGDGGRDPAPEFRKARPPSPAFRPFLLARPVFHPPPAAFFR
jgi:hypothetical protein